MGALKLDRVDGGASLDGVDGGASLDGDFPSVPSILFVLSSLSSLFIPALPALPSLPSLPFSLSPHKINPVRSTPYFSPFTFHFSLFTFPFPLIPRKALFVNKFAPLGLNIANSYGGCKKSLYLCISTRACVRVRGATDSMTKH